MRLWLSRSVELSLREQLVTQVVLGILSRELTPGQRLPSTRELARRFGIHANTASAAYRQLESEGWLESRHGSGIYVCSQRPAAPLTPELIADRLIGDLAAKARELGVAESLLRSRLRRWLLQEPPSRWLLIEPDPELARIVLHEMEQALRLPVTICAPEESADQTLLAGAMPVVLPSKAAAVRKLLPPGTELTVLQIHPVSPELGGYLPVPEGVLVGIASRWLDFQRIAQTMLVAAGLPAESLLVKDAGQPGWKRGLDATAAVVCDAATAAELPRRCRAIVFSLVAESSIKQLKETEAELLRSSESTKP